MSSKSGISDVTISAYFEHAMDEPFNPKPLSCKKSKIFSHLWGIDNRQMYRGEWWSKIEDHNGNNWELTLNDDIVVDDTFTKCIKLSLTLLSYRRPQVNASICFILFNEKSEEIMRLDPGTAHDFLAKPEFHSYLDLKIRPVFVICNIDIHDGVQLATVPSSVCDDFGHLLDSGKYGDVIFVVGNREFRAHKCILVARSDAFAAMFEHDMVESQTNRVNISDVKPEVFQEMLRFLYTGISPNIYEMTIELLALADKYVLEELRRMCISVINQSVTLDSAIDILLIAEHYNENQLKDNMTNFIKFNAKTIMETDGWASLCKSHEQLVRDIYDFMENPGKEYVFPNRKPKYKPMQNG